MNTQQATNMGLQQGATVNKICNIKNINDYIYKETFKLEKQ